LLKRQRGFAVLAVMAILALAAGMRGRLYRAPEVIARRDLGSWSRLPASPAYMVHLEPGGRLEGGNPPQGWSHLVIKSIPRLATGDLDTVSAQAFETAQRIRPLIVADVRRSSDDPGAPFRLARVGVGLCAPAKETDTDLVISASSVEGTRGSWTTKQRVILAAMALETSRARLAAATSTFALIHTPVTFLVSGEHRKLDVCYALLVDSRTGELRTIVWRDSPATGPHSPARDFPRRVFDSPLDVKASKLPGGIPVAWSFAVREFPPGSDLAFPPDLASLLKSSNDKPDRSAQIEEALIGLLQEATPNSSSLAHGSR
jgi:hypothetical protein